MCPTGQPATFFYESKIPDIEAGPRISRSPHRRCTCRWRACFVLCAAKCFLDMLATFAEFETNLRRERQLEGIVKAKASGIYAGKGRPVSIDAPG